MSPTAHGTASFAARHPAVKTGARLGYAANGVINVLIGWIALQLALGGGSSGEQADASGALQMLAEQPFGSVLLWVVLVGFALLGLWNVATAFWEREAKDKAKAAAKGVTYLVLAGLTTGVLTGSGGGGGGGMTAQLMQQPFGRVLVALVGLGVLGVGVYQVVKGWKRKFLEDLQGHPPQWAVHAGRAGYTGRGVAFGVLGGLFGVAAATADAERAEGLDSALQSLRDAPFGKVLLVLVALGFVAYGVYSFARAKYARL